MNMEKGEQKEKCFHHPAKADENPFLMGKKIFPINKHIRNVS
jgi:hypothetical protein